MAKSLGCCHQLKERQEMAQLSALPRRNMDLPKSRRHSSAEHIRSQHRTQPSPGEAIRFIGLQHFLKPKHQAATLATSS